MESRLKSTLRRLWVFFVLADKWQVLSIATPALAQIQQHLTLKLAMELLNASASYPDQIWHAAIVTVVDNDEKQKATLQLVSPNRQSSRAGVYELIVGRKHNNLPVWKQSGGDNMIYTVSGYCMVGTAPHMAEQSGVIISTAAIDGRSPAEAEDWELRLDGRWVHDVDV